VAGGSDFSQSSWTLPVIRIAEFCIDKLYSPDSSAGRLGLVEMRAFEMPPHARMSLAQQLLVRALVAWFWREPYAQTPIRWGTRLDDQFLLPYFVEKDFQTVIGDLQRAGYSLDPAWFAPHTLIRGHNNRLADARIMWPTPGGRNYETFPVNSNEAEARRIARFFGFGHTPGPMHVSVPVIDPEFPTTLDLRKQSCRRGL